MSQHQRTRPPPAANAGLDLDDVVNNSSRSRSGNRRATTSFPATAEKSARIKTEHAPLGDPGRTVLEGYEAPTAIQTVITPTVVPGTQLRGLVPASQAGNYPAHTPTINPAAPSIKSPAPTWARNVLTKPDDQEMASRQTAFASLTPDEQVKQNTWAQGVIKRSIRCPKGYHWDREEEHKGYRCAGGYHFVTDDLLGEGKGGILLIPGGKRNKMEKWWGPYFPDPEQPDRFVYGGPETVNVNFSMFGPDWTEVKTSTWHWPKLWQIIEGLEGPPGNEADYPLLEQGLSSLWCRPMKLESKSHGATLVIKKDKVEAPDPSQGRQDRNVGSGSGGGSGSEMTGAVTPRSPSESRNKNFGSQLRSPGSHHSLPLSYHSNINAVGPVDER